MSVQISIHPEPGDEPRGRINPGTYPGRPESLPVRPFGALHLDSATSYISLGQLTDDQAVAYLDHLADEASSLAAKIRRQQQDARMVAAAIHPAAREVSS